VCFHHRPDVGLGRDLEVEQHGAAVVVGLLDRGVDLRAVGDADRLDAVGVGELHEVGLADRDRDVVVLVEQLLPLPDHAEVAVVDDRELHRELLVDQRRQLLERHLEAAVAADRPHRAVAARDLRAHRGRHLEAHRPEAARGDQLMRPGHAHVLGGPHLVLPDAGHDHRVVVVEVGDALDHVLGGQLRPARDRQRARVGVAHLIDPVDPLHVRALRNRRGELRQHVLHVADDRHRGRQVLAVLAGVDVDVDQARALVEVLEAPDRAVVHAVADTDHEVGVRGRHVRLVGAVHAQHPVRQHVRPRDAAQPQQRVQHRHAAVLRERAQLLAGVAEDHAVPGDDQRPLGGLDQPRRVRDVPDVGGAGHVVAAHGHRFRPLELGLVDEDVLGDVDVHRAGAAGGREVRGLGEGVGQILHAHHEVVVLDARHRDPGRVGLLEAVLADQVARHVAGDEQRRHRVHVGVLDRGHEVRRAGPGGRQRAAEAPAGARVAVRGVAAALLVADEDVVDLGVRGEAVVEREHDAAGVAEDGVDADALQGLEHDVRAADLHRGFLPVLFALPAVLGRLARVAGRVQRREPDTRADGGTTGLAVPPSAVREGGRAGARSRDSRRSRGGGRGDSPA
jgi:hypothetical protein